MPDLFENPADKLLYNNVRATSAADLDQKEADLSLRRLMLIRAQVGLRTPRPTETTVSGPSYPLPPTPATFDEQFMRAMHRYLFQDVYPWAGETRQDRGFQGVKPANHIASRHNLTFANHRRISADTAAVSAQLSQENNLKGLTKPQFIERAAYYLDHFNHIHTFREGNGRTLQGVMMQLGQQAGYRINFDKVYNQYNLARDTGIVGAVVQQRENQTRLRYMLDAATSELPGAAAKAARHPSQARPITAPTPEIARIEALREVKASSQPVSIRFAEETGAMFQSPILDYIQATVMARPEAITEAKHLSQLKEAMGVIRDSELPKLSDTAVLQRFDRAIENARQLQQIALAPQPTQAQATHAGITIPAPTVPAPLTAQPAKVEVDPAGKIAPPLAPMSETPKQKAPAPKRRGPKL